MGTLLAPKNTDLPTLHLVVGFKVCEDFGSFGPHMAFGSALLLLSARALLWEPMDLLLCCCYFLPVQVGLRTL